MSTEETLDDFLILLSLDEEAPAIGDFIAGDRDVIAPLKNLRTKYLTEVGHDSESMANWALYEFHRDVLDFAEWLLEKHDPHYFACIAQLAAYVANDGCTKEIQEKVEQIFDVIEEDSDEMPRDIAFGPIIFETYYCSSRHFRVETYLGSKLQKFAAAGAVDFVNVTIDGFCHTFVECANSAHKFPSGDAVLMMALDLINDSCRTLPIDKRLNKKETIEHLGNWVRMAKLIGRDLPNDTVLAASVIGTLNEAMSQLLNKDQSEAKNQLNETLNYCREIKSPNGPFVAYLEEKIANFTKQDTTDLLDAVEPKGSFVPTPPKTSTALPKGHRLNPHP